MNLRIVAFFISLLACSVLYGQNIFHSKLFKRAKYDSTYVDSYYDQYLHVTLISNSQNIKLDVNNNLNNQTVSYKPNNVFRFGFGIDYNLFSMEYTHSIDAFDSPDPKQGQTESFGLRLGITGRRILTNLIGQRYKGMYISNADELAQNGYPLQSKIRPDMKSEFILGSFNYFYNHQKYSTMASLWQIDKQKKSAGSFVSGLTFSAMHISADSSFLPSQIAVKNNNGERIIDNYNYLIGINTGYAYNFIFFKKWFINLMFIPGVNIQNGHNINEQHFRTNYNYKFGYHADVRMVGGYNGERYYFGVHSANYYLSNAIKDNVDVNLSNTYFRVFIGRRFYLALLKMSKKK